MISLRSWFWRLGRIRLPKWVFIALGLLMVAILIWFVGPLISIAKWAPLKGWISRTVFLALLALGVGGYYGWRFLQRKKKNEQFLATLDTETKAADPQDYSAQDIEAMNERAEKALALMRETRLGQNKEYVYELPWYLIIGPPGAGKTTALHNAGLKFPVAQEVGAEPLRGIGGTRTCEWWFTDQAVLIDTAGRYTTQDSNAEADAESWQGFLSTLQRHRPRQPVTGLIVALSVADLIGGDERETAAHGRAIRARINEVTQKLGFRPPVYVLLTKMDLLAGFTEFFDDAGQAERDQVWGHTFDIEVSRAGSTPGPAFEQAFDALIQRLNDRLLARIQAERDLARRGLIFGFPQQVQGLRAQLAALMQVIGRETKFEPTPLIRGVYFTSAAQYGRPIDRLMGAIARKFGVDAHSPARDGDPGRSYFLRNLLHEVIFKEAALADRDPKSEKRRRLIRYGAMAAAASLALVFIVGWGVSYARTASLVRKLEDRSQHLQKMVAALPSGDVSDSDLVEILPALDEARALPFASTAPKDLRASKFGMGLGRKKAMQTQVDAAYQNLLNQQMLPRLVLDLEDQLRAALQSQAAGSGDQRAAIYSLLRVYLMLGRAPGAPMERSHIKTWFAAEFADRYPGSEDDPTREALEHHVDALVSGRLAPPKLDRELIAQARAQVRGLTTGERAYARLLSDPEIGELTPFTLSGIPVVGESGLFARRSGKSLSLGVPGLYRRQIFFSTVMPAIAKAAAQSANETWVTGEPAPSGKMPVTAEVGRIKDEMLVAYLKDFTRQWDDYINDITISGEHPSGERIRIAAQPPSPVKLLINALAAETNLTPPKVGTRQGGGAAGAAVRVASIFSPSIYRGLRGADRIGYEINGSGRPAAPPGPLDEVIAHFKWLQDMNPAQGPSPLDGALQALSGVGDSAIAAQAAAGLGDPLLQRTKTSSAMEATARLNEISATLPPVVQGMFTGFVKASTTQLNNSVKQSIQQTYAGELLPQCQSIVGQGFPFNGGGRQTSIDDLSRLLRPAGLMDTFVTNNLSGMIDTTSASWGPTQAGRVLGLQPASIRQFEKADRIRKRMFMPGDVRPNIRFFIEPVQISPDVTTAALTIDGSAVVYTRGDRRGVEMKWPGSSPGVTLNMQRAGGGPVTKSWSGDFALFQMIRDGQVTSSSARSMTVKLAVDGAEATYTFRFVNTGNPFNFADLMSLTCPTRL